MKVLVCGDRFWTDKELIYRTLSSIPDIDLIIEGEARGADILARRCAEELGIEVNPVPAQWEKYGKAAGPIRNRVMLDMHPNLVIAFHDNLAGSKGTADTVQEAKRRGITVRHITH